MIESNQRNQSPTPRLILRRPSELAAIKAVSWRIEDILPDGMLALLHAQDKVGKTLLAWEMARAVVTGTEFLDTFPTTQGKVVLVLLDDPTELTRERCHAFGLSENEDVRLVTPNEVASMSEPGRVIGDLATVCSAFSPQLVVIDALYLFGPTGKDAMNDVSRMRPLMTKFNDLAQSLQAAVVVIAHDKKSGETVAGSHAITASAKALLHLTISERNTHEASESGQRVLEIKSKMTRPARHLLSLEGAGDWRYIGPADSNGQLRQASIRDRVLEFLHANREASSTQLATALRVRKADILLTVEELEEQEVIKVCPRPRIDGKKGRPAKVYVWLDATIN